jgi:tyrosinase
MATLASMQERTWALLMRPSPPARRSFLEQARAIAPEREEVIEQFSVFEEQHLTRALEVAAELMRLANAEPAEDAVEQALDYYEQLGGQEHPDLLDYALIVFITHHPRGRALTHAIPPITLRNPELVAPSMIAPDQAVHGSETLASLLRRLEDESAFPGGAIPTDNLEWYREDPFANEHHTHWHVVYPWAGSPDPGNPGQMRFKDRQGEVFFYMHQQMLARYDAERLALGLGPVQSLQDYDAPIAVGYDPGPYLEANLYFTRQRWERMVGTPTRPIREHERFRDRLDQAVTDLVYSLVQPHVEMVNPEESPHTEPDRLGHAIEATNISIGVADQFGNKPYGNLHNPGHTFISRASKDESGTSRSGVMLTPTTAIRDPAFWEWHRHIDDFYWRWQEQQTPYAFTDAPPVRIRKQLDPTNNSASSPDVLLVLEQQLPPEVTKGSEGLQEWPNLRSWAQATFGGDHWDDDDTAAGLTTVTLETEMLQRPLVLADRVTTVPLQHLTHRPFVYVLRIENTADRPVQATVRIFLVPVTSAEERRTWIEMDKFVHTLQPLEKAVVSRRGAQSSVILKPANMTPQVLNATTILITQAGLDAMVNEGLSKQAAATLRPFVDRTTLASTIVRALGNLLTEAVRDLLIEHATITEGEQPFVPPPDTPPDEIQEIEERNYCTCGWPYNLLLPRGTPEGMPFRLAVVCTDWEKDHTPADALCGSLSFCGARDVYPDMRPMGYPFDRRFASEISATILANDNMAFRDIVIRRMHDVVEQPDEG